MAQWIIYALLSSLFAALTAIFAKKGLATIDSGLATAIRTGIVLIVTWLLVFYRGKANETALLSKSNWIYLTLSALATGASWLFYNRALQLGEVSGVAAIDKGSIVFTILLSFIFLGEPLSPKILVGGGLVFAGMLVMVFWK